MSALLLPVCCLLACACEIGRTGAAAPLADVPSLRILYTADTAGQLDSCGCSAGQLGGLPRRWALLEFLRQGPTPSLVLDGGGLVSDARQMPYMAEAYRLLGYDLVAPAGSDSADGGVDALRGAGVRVLSRPRDVTTGAVPVEILRAGDVRVAVLAAPDCSVEDAPRLAEAVARACGATPEASDVRVLLTRYGHADNQRLAELLGADVDLVLGSATDAEDLQYGEIAVCGAAIPAAAEGRTVTVVDVYADQAGGRPHLSGRLEPVASGLYREPRLLELVDRYYAEAADRTRVTHDEGDGDGPVAWIDRGYAEPAVCGECHTQEYATWRASAHAGAVGTLSERGRLVDECLECHSEEFRRNAGFDPGNVVPGDGVTCTTCHGGGLAHSLTGSAEHVARTMAPEGCMACHSADRQPAGFDYSTSWTAIAHGRQGNG